MRKTITVLALLACGFAGGYLCSIWRQASAQEGGRRWTPDLRGDVNADGALNISDAVFILNFIFMGGDAPPRLLPGEPGLLVTGQIRCFSGLRGEEQNPCPQPGMDDYGQDGNFRAGIPRSYELVKEVEEDTSTWITLDRSTGLMWQYTDDSVKRSWRETLKHVEELELGGFDDWRLPNIQELYSIVDISRNNPSVSRDFFSLKPLVYWSSSTCVFDTSRAWTVRFNDGFVNCLDKGGQGQNAFTFFSLAVRPIE